MVKTIISVVVTIAFVVGGAFGASMLRPAPAAVAHASADQKAEKKEKKKSDDHEGEQKEGKYQYFDFSRQFVVPVMENGRLTALVIMDINLELESSKADGAYAMEPKLRDALTRELLKLSNDGLFDGQLTDPDNFDVMQASLLKAVRRVKEGVHSVLILDIARQEQ